MFKTVVYGLLLLTTALRLVDMVYLLSREVINLPAPVIVVQSAMILYGIVLLAQRFISSVRLRPVTVFFAVQAVMFLFNITYTALTSPLRFTALEMIAVGTFLDVLVNAVIVYFCVKRMRARSFVTVGHVQ